VYRASLPFLILVLLAPGCANTGVEATPPEDAIEPADVQKDALADMDQELPGDGPEISEPSVIASAEVFSHPRSPIAAVVLVETATAAQVRVRFISEGEPARFTRWTAPGTDHALEVFGLMEKRTWTLEVQAQTQAQTPNGELATGSPLTFVPGNLPQGMPVFEITAHDPEHMAPGLTFFGVAQLKKPANDALPLFVAVDDQGRVVWLYQDLDAGHESVARALKVVDQETLLLVVSPGFRTISLGGEIKLHVPGGPSIGGNIHHEAVALDNGHFLALVGQTKQIEIDALGGTVKVRGDRVVELDATGEVVWNWSTFDHIDNQLFPTTLSRKPSKKDSSYDWTHANAIVPLDGGDFLLSMRHQHQVARVDRSTGEIAWLLGAGGDFTLESGDWFYGQHGPHLLEDGTLLLYDNGNDRPGETPVYSRAAGYTFDEALGTAQEVYSYGVPEFTSFLGGVQGLENGSVLICAGGVRAPVEGGGSISGTARIIEVADNGDEVWRLETQGSIYRALRADGLLWTDE
jgi:arylsulfate sulfotransferase